MHGSVAPQPLVYRRDGKGKISFDEAKLHAGTEFEKYRVIQDRNFENDFDRLLKNQEKS